MGSDAKTMLIGFAVVAAYLVSFGLGATTVLTADDAPVDAADNPDVQLAKGHGTWDVEFDFDGNTTDDANDIVIDTELDFRVFNIGNSNAENVTLHAPGENRSVLGDAAFVTDVGSNPDASGGEAIFSDIIFNQVGQWNVSLFDSSDTHLEHHTFEVLGVEDLVVTVTPTEFTFPGNRTTEVSVLVTWEANGTAVEGAHISINNSVGEDIVPPATGTTNANGKLTINRNFWRADRGSDIYDVEAVFPDPSNAKHRGDAQFDVNPATPRLDSSSGVPPTHGFTSQVQYVLFYPNNDPASEHRILDDAQIDNGNLTFWSVTLLEGGVAIDNLTVEAADTPCDPSCDGNNAFSPIISVNATGILNLTHQWADATYEVVVQVERTGNNTRDDQFEYRTVLSFSPKDPQAVNLFLDPEEVDVPARAQNTSVDRPTILFTLTILGEDETTFPADVDDLDVTVEGPFIGTARWPTDWDTSTTTADGKATIALTPSEGDSELVFNVVADDANIEGTASISAIVDGGDILTTDASTVTVGVETTVTLTLEDRFGNRIPDGNVELFWDGNGTNIDMIEGDGSPGEGQNGQYTFDVDINQAIGRVIAHSVDLQLRHAYASFRVVPAHDLDVAVDPHETLAGRDQTYDLNVTRDGEVFSDAVDAYVLNATQYDEFVEDGILPEATLANVTLTTVSDGNYTFTVLGESAEYTVYVKSEDDLHDNEGIEPHIHPMPAVTTLSPAVLVNNVDANVTVELTLMDPVTGDPLNGTLAVHTAFPQNATFWESDAMKATGTVTRAAANGTIEYTQELHHNGTYAVENGEVTLGNVTAENVGNVQLYFLEDSTGAVYALADGVISIQAPDVSIAPDQVCVGSTTQLTITVTHPVTGAAIPNATVRLEGGGLAPVEEETDADGVAEISIVPPSSSTVTVFVNGDEATTFRPLRCLSINFDQPEYEPGSTVLVTVTERGTLEAEDGVNIRVDGNAIGVTGNDGTLTFTAPSTSGTHTVTASKAGFHTRTRTFTVATVPTAEFQVSNVHVTNKGDDDQVNVGEDVLVQANVENVGAAAGSVDIVLLVDGALRGQQNGVSIASGADRTVAFDWKAPSQTGTVTVIIEAGDASDSIQVEIVGPPGIPGFELVAVLAAAGAAALLMRRREL